MLETTTAWESGPAEGPIGFTNGIFIVVGGTSVENHHVARPRIVGVPRPISVEAVTGSVATTTARAWISPPSVKMRSPSPTLRVTPITSTPCSTGCSRPRESWFGKRLHAQRGQGGHARRGGTAC